MKNLILQIGNIVVFLVMLVMNYSANTGAINGETMASVSAEYQNLFTPAGYAFSIWGVIYVFLLAFIIFLSGSFYKDDRGRAIVYQVGVWFIFSCVLNVSWIMAWLNHFTGISVLIMILLLFSLFKIIRSTRMGDADGDFSGKLCVLWPFSLYSGWICVALIANIAAFLESVGWSGWGFSEVFWTITVIIVAAILNLLVIWRHKMPVFGLAGAWGLIAVGIGNLNNDRSIVFTAFLVAFLLLVSSGIQTGRSTIIAWGKN